MPKYLYTSLVVDDLTTSQAAFENLGFIPVWEGRHEALATSGSVLATRQGGVLLLAATDGAHPLVESRRQSPERWFHIAFRDEGMDVDALRDQPGVSVSEAYQGPFGEAVLATLTLADGAEFAVEVFIGPGPGVGEPGSALLRVESTALATGDRTATAKAFEPLGLDVSPAFDANFPTLACDTHIAFIESTYIEFAQPTGPGAVASLLDRIGTTGIFGVNVEAADLNAFVTLSHERGIHLNTHEAEPLPTVVAGKEVVTADIITVNPRVAGGRLFVLRSRDYPWNMPADD